MAGTLTTVMVFFPVVFLKGISGVIYQQMAYVVTFSLFCSLGDSSRREVVCR